MIIAFTGKKRTGKDTCVAYLREQYPNMKFTRYGFADPIKRICADVFGWGERELYGDLKEIIDEFWGISPREAMQVIGTELFQFALMESSPGFAESTGRTIWVKRFINKVRKGGGNWLISDLRFPHEIRTIRDMLPNERVILVRLNKNGTAGDAHASETEMENILPEYEVRNDGTFAELYLKLDEIITTAVISQVLEEPSLV